MSTEYIRITYQCLGRTFDRLFKEQSLDETKNVVRRKLGLAYGAPIELAQLRDGRKIDLEDDDDFEAFKALTRTSLHAIVTVAIPENGSSAIPVVANAPGERKGRSKASHPVPCAQEAAQFGTAAPTTESRLQPSVMHATGAAPPRKKRKVAFNDDTVTSPDLQNPQQPTLKNARPSSSRAMPTTVVHESISGAAAMPLSEPTTSHPRSQAEKRSSSQIRMDETGKSKRKIAEITRSKRDPTESSAEASLKKRKMKCSASSRKHSSPEHEESRGDMSFDAPKKVSRKDQTVLPELPTESSIPTGIHTHNQAKTRKEQAGNADIETSYAESKTGSVALATDGDGIPDPITSYERGTAKEKVQSEVSNASLDDDIDKTIATFLTKRLQADRIAFSAMATECIVPVDDPPLKTKRKSHKVKLRAGVDGTTHLASQKNTASSMEALETNGPEGSIVRKGSKRTRKSSTLNAVEPNEHNVLVAVGEETSQAPTISECHVALAGPPETQPRSQLGSAQHRNVDSSDKEISQVSVPTSSAGHSKASLNTQVTAPKCTEISEVALEVYSEGNSDQSSDEGETEENRLYRVTGSVNASAASVLPLEDRLAALIHGTVKRGPRASILNEIPSSSETGSESSAEDLILDEEEDLWRQPSHKQIIALLTTRPSSTEPERTSEDEDNASAPVDMSHEVSDRPQKLPPIGGTGDHASNNLEREATERPAHDTNPVKPCEIQKRISSISPPSAPNKVDDTVPSSHFTKIPGAEYPVSIVAPINTEPAKTPILASDKGKTGRVLVSASSPVIDGAAAKTRSQLQHANDDVESIVGSHDGNEESDPIEPEPTQPSANLSQSIDPNPHHPRKCGPHNASKPPPVSQQPSRRSGRLANRLSHMETPEATLIPLTQVRHKIPSSFEDPRLWMHDDEGAAREQGLRKQGGKLGINFPRAITQHASDSGDETSPSVAREDGSPRVLISSQVKWTTLLLSEQTQPDASSIIDELRTSSQGSSAKLAPRGDEPSPSSGKNKTPVPTRRRIGRGGKGKGIAQPLFFPGSSQLPPVPSPSGTGSENESQTAASVLAKKTPSRSTSRSGSQFRRLTDIASNDILFSKSKAAKQIFKNRPSLKVQSKFEAGLGDDHGGDEESSTSSSDDSVVNSHIPKDRRVGTATRRKGQGLSSLHG